MRVDGTAQVSTYMHISRCGVDTQTGGLQPHRLDGYISVGLAWLACGLHVELCDACVNARVKRMNFLHYEGLLVVQVRD